MGKNRARMPIAFGTGENTTVTGVEFDENGNLVIGNSSEQNLIENSSVLREKVELAIDDIYNEGLFTDDLLEVYNDTTNHANSPEVLDLKEQLEQYFEQQVGEKIPVFMGYESKNGVLAQLKEGETAVEVYPDGRYYVDFDVLTKGVD